ncbi:cupin domain-containing protein [Lentzea sp. JNUCC 0626]|uniref:cupin domain-containing protein n=1 Tax=Lentzea sp. JNUCC 0626 TaxID=3367513 RepID=UPI0037484DF9
MSAGVSGRIRWEHTDRVTGTRLLFREVTIAPGGDTGWHYHQGLLVGKLVEGRLTHQERDHRHTYETGAVIVEWPGADKVHIGLNEGDVPLVLEVLYILPNGVPLAVEAPSPELRARVQQH